MLFPNGLKGRRGSPMLDCPPIQNSEYRRKKIARVQTAVRYGGMNAVERGRRTIPEGGPINGHQQLGRKRAETDASGQQTTAGKLLTEWRFLHQTETG